MVVAKIHALRVLVQLRHLPYFIFICKKNVIRYFYKSKTLYNESRINSTIKLVYIKI